MYYKYKIYGMTCEGCVQSVKNKISSIDKVVSVEVSLAKSILEVNTTAEITKERFARALGEKYTLENPEATSTAENYASSGDVTANKWVQLKPLFLIFFYLFAAALLLNFKDWKLADAMLDFMGLFYIVFSFFKFLDLKNFPESFKMYDPLAKKLPLYGKVYPFIELALGLLFLMRLHLMVAVITTILVLGITTVGVAKSLLDKKTIRCACLGTVLKLPMTEATIIENVIMLVMAFYMLFTF